MLLTLKTVAELYPVEHLIIVTVQTRQQLTMLNLAVARLDHTFTQSIPDLDYSLVVWTSLNLSIESCILDGEWRCG